MLPYAERFTLRTDKVTARTNVAPVQGEMAQLAASEGLSADCRYDALRYIAALKRQHGSAASWSCSFAPQPLRWVASRDTVDGELLSICRRTIPQSVRRNCHPAFASPTCHWHDAAHLHKEAKDRKIYSENRRIKSSHQRCHLTPSLQSKKSQVRPKCYDTKQFMRVPTGRAGETAQFFMEFVKNVTMGQQSVQRGWGRMVQND